MKLDGARTTPDPRVDGVSHLISIGVHLRSGPHLDGGRLARRIGVSEKCVRGGSGDVVVESRVDVHFGKVVGSSGHGVGSHGGRAARVDVLYRRATSAELESTLRCGGLLSFRQTQARGACPCDCTRRDHRESRAPSPGFRGEDIIRDDSRDQDD